MSYGASLELGERRAPATTTSSRWGSAARGRPRRAPRPCHGGSARGAGRARACRAARRRAAAMLGRTRRVTTPRCSARRAPNSAVGGVCSRSTTTTRSNAGSAALAAAGVRGARRGSRRRRAPRRTRARSPCAECLDVQIVELDPERRRAVVAAARRRSGCAPTTAVLGTVRREVERREELRCEPRDRVAQRRHRDPTARARVGELRGRLGVREREALSPRDAARRHERVEQALPDDEARALAQVQEEETVGPRAPRRGRRAHRDVAAGPRRRTPSAARRRAARGAVRARR